MPTIVSVNEIFDEPRRFRVDDRLVRTYKRTFRVEFDTINVGPSYSAFATGIPRVYDPLETADEYDAGLQVKDVESVQDSQDPHFHLVTVEYSSETPNDPQQVTAGGGGGGGGGSGGDPVSENPLLMPPQIVIGATRDSEVVTKTTHVPPQAITNSATQPVSPKPTKDKHRQSITYTRNVLVHDRKVARTRFDKVNSVAIWDYPARSLRLHYITAQRAYSNRFAYWVETWYFESKLPNWDARPLDIGTRQLDDDGKQVELIRRGVPVGEFLLDGNGKPLADGAEPVFRGPYQIYQVIDFATFGLTGL